MTRKTIPPEQAQAWALAMALFDRWPELDASQREREAAALSAASPPALGLLRTLLEAESEADGKHFLERVPAFDSITILPPSEDAEELAPPRQQVGHWTLDRQLGAGGMGRVWLAHRDDGMYEGSVAIKMLLESTDSTGARERFAREGRMLARLSHPNIARLIDAGFLPEGQRYLVLEYVAGQRIDAYCDERRLSLRERVRLFRQVCLAVAHAHANLVVHRDLKPANILVQADGQVKLLDFGIAKLVEENAGEGSEPALTQVGGRAMTPEYASPEQIDGGAITTASDVYALGVVLYRLLAGASPYLAGSGSPSRLAREIAEAEPRSLVDGFASASAASSGDAHAASRSGDAAELRRDLAGDLQLIVAKAMRKEPLERYASASAMLGDLDAFLENRPISATPPTFVYVASKFVRRHRVGVVLAGAALFALMGSLGALVWETRIAWREEARALLEAQHASEQRAIADREAMRARDEAARAGREELRARRETLRATTEEAKAREYGLRANAEALRAGEQEKLAREQTRKAREEAAKATALKDFMIDVFRVNMPAGGSIEAAQNTSSKELLESGAKRLSGKFADQPGVRSEMLDILGELFYRLGDVSNAERMARERVALEREGNSAEDRRKEMAARTNLASVLLNLGDTSAVLAELDAQEALADRMGSSGERWRGHVALNRGRALLATDPNKAILFAREALQRAAADPHLQSNAGHRAHALETLSRAFFQIENYSAADAAASEAHRIMVAAIGKDTFGEVKYLILLGQAQRGLGQRRDAAESLRRAETVAARTLGKNNLDTLFARMLWLALRHESGSRDALEQMQATTRVMESVRGAQGWSHVWSRLELAHALFAEGRLGECRRELDKLVARLRSSGEYRLVLARALVMQARLHFLHGDTSAGERLAAEAAEIAKAECGEQSPTYLAAGAVAIRRAMIEDRYAEFRFAPVFATLQSSAAPRGPLAADAQDIAHFVADYLLRRGEKYAALEKYEAIIEAIESEGPERADAHDLARALLGAGRVHFLGGDYQAAREALSRAVKLRERLGPDDSLWLAEARLALADCLLAEGMANEGKRLIALAAGVYEKNAPLGLEYTRTLAQLRERAEAARNPVRR